MMANKELVRPIARPLARPIARRALTALTLSAAALAVLPGAASGEEAAGVLRRASAVMGAGELKSIRYTAEGSGYTFGQAYTPGAAWPKITVHSQIRSINYDTASMREEFTLSRAEPRGGGGYPLAGQQRNDQFVSGDFAWNQAGTNAVPGPRFVADRVHQLWLTPHGVIKAAIKNNATLAWRTQNGKSVAVVSYKMPRRFAATAFINEDYLVERAESRLPDPVLGETTAVTTYSGYRDFGGVNFPSRVEQSQGGHPILDVSIKEVQPNAPADIALPDNVRSATERVTADRVAEGVWFIAGGSHNSVAIEMKDHMVLVETPLNDGRSAPVIEQVKKLAPGKPIRFIINSHAHFDHAGGVRTAVAEGATIVTHATNEAYFKRIFALQNRINPDRLAKSGKKPKFKTVNDKLELADGTRTIAIHRITGGDHNDAFLMVHLPQEKLLVEADVYTPGPPNAPPPATPNANNVTLVKNIERLNLAVDKILPLHGRVVPLSELYTAAKATLPK
ncbi:MAG: MBL fold metallo-hydrolase [Proteobacteria bacterium]|nr:MBL fold metallo-hydrolase [Pseudomonadota bacterium]